MDDVEIVWFVVQQVKLSDNNLNVIDVSFLQEKNNTVMQCTVNISTTKSEVAF